MVFNASDPSGAGGLAADVTAIASVGAHALPVVTGAYARDTAEVFDHFAFDEDVIAEQARAILEDVAVQVIKVGFVGSPEAISTIAEIAADYCRSAAGRVHAQPVVVGRRPDRPVPRRVSRTDAAADDRVGRKPQHAVALAAARVEQRPQPHRPRHREGRVRDGRAVHAGHRHPAARAVHRQRARHAAGGAVQRKIRTLRSRVLRRRRHPVGGAGGAGRERHGPGRRRDGSAQLSRPLPRRGLPAGHGQRRARPPVLGPARRRTPSPDRGRSAGPAGLRHASP